MNGCVELMNSDVFFKCHYVLANGFILMQTCALYSLFIIFQISCIPIIFIIFLKSNVLVENRQTYFVISNSYNLISFWSMYYFFMPKGHKKPTNRRNSNNSCQHNIIVTEAGDTDRRTKAQRLVVCKGTE